MYRYMGVIYNPNDPAAAACGTNFIVAISRESSGLTPRLSMPGFTVFADSPEKRGLRTYMLPRDGGLVLGRIFPKQPLATPSDCEVIFSEHVATQISITGGTHLLEKYWGQYIAFIRGACHSQIRVIRDPSGMLPCYYLSTRGAHVFFSDVADLDLLDLAPFTINERYIAASIYNTLLQIRDTAFNEIRELLAGDRIEISDRGVSHAGLWDPRRIALHDQIEEVEPALSALRETTQACIDAWSRYHRKVLLSLSGGLDSAIVLGCLGISCNRPETVCFNQYKADTLGDERPFARAAARRAGVQLVEKPWTGTRYTRRLFNFPRAVKPTATDLHFMLEIDFRNTLAEQMDADAIWTGQGGDHLFWALRRFVPVVADYVHDHGFGRQIFRQISESSRLSERSYWSTCWMTAKLSTARRSWISDQIFNPNRHFVSADALGADIAEYTANPWTARLDGLAPVKHNQIVLLADVLNRHRHLAGAERAYEHHPLLSQPIVELCLRIPTYLLVFGGQSRALARKAFEQVVPSEILRRTDKGDYSPQARELIRESEPFLCDLLLDGFLVRNRLVSRRELEHYLVQGQSLRDDQIWPLASCVAVEIWVDAWRRHGRLRCAA